MELQLWESRWRWDLGGRFAERLVMNTEECWIWIGRLNEQGYGLGRLNKKWGLVHRLVYENLLGDPGPNLDHLCHSWAVYDGLCAGGPLCPHRSCCNPAHLQPTSRLENVRRGRHGVIRPGADMGSTPAEMSEAVARLYQHCPLGARLSDAELELWQAKAGRYFSRDELLAAAMAWRSQRLPSLAQFLGLCHSVREERRARRQAEAPERMRSQAEMARRAREALAWSDAELFGSGEARGRAMARRLHEEE